MQEFMYDVSSIWIVGVLFISMALAIETGFHVGRRVRVPADDASHTQTNTIEGALLGILALLLAFTFSLSLQRFDTRSDAVVDEANAIGTAYLRAQLLPVSVRSDVQKLLRDYVDLRVQEGAISTVYPAKREALLVKTSGTQSALWAYAMQAAEEDPSPVKTGLFIQALNELIDSYGRHDAALSRHVPEVVLLLLYGAFVLVGAIVGYASGLTGQRTSFVTYTMVGLVVLLVFVIIDLDRPRRGLIHVSEKNLTDLQAAMHAEE